MSRYIDAEQMVDDGKNTFPYNISFCDEGDIENWIRDQPTCDVVPVIRCKNCRNFENDCIADDVGWCNKLERAMQYDCFCCYGEEEE